MTETEKDASAKETVGKKYDLTAAYERSAHLMIPRAFFPVFSTLFVFLCGAMAVLLFGAGKIFGGALFSFVVLVGAYVLWNNLRPPRDPS
jgi:hypothetical protein